MDTQNDGLAKVDSFKIWPFLVSMLDFWGVHNVCFLILRPFVPPTKQVWQGPMNMVSGAHMFKLIYVYVVLPGGTHTLFRSIWSLTSSP